MEDSSERSRADGSVPSQSILHGAHSRFLSLATLALVVGAVWRWQVLTAGEWIWLAAFVLTMAIRAPHLKRNEANRIRHASAGMGETVLTLTLLATLLLPLVHLATGILSAFDYRLPFACTLFGGLLQFPYLWLFYRAHADLRRNWSPGLEIRDGHELVMDGIYASIRHPMYAAIWLSALGQPLLVQNWLAGPPVLLAMSVFWFLRVPAEERMMVAHFGEAYLAYCARTGRFLPARSHG